MWPVACGHWALALALAVLFGTTLLERSHQHTARESAPAQLADCVTLLLPLFSVSVSLCCIQTLSAK